MNDIEWLRKQAETNDARAEAWKSVALASRKLFLQFCEKIGECSAYARAIADKENYTITKKLAQMSKTLEQSCRQMVSAANIPVPDVIAEEVRIIDTAEFPEMMLARK